MLATFVIGLREGLEAALIVGIIAAFLRRNGKSLAPMWIGVVLAVVLSIAVGVGLHLIEQELPQSEQEKLETVIGAVAIFFVTGMIVWMNTHSRQMKNELEAEAALALSQGGAYSLALMAFLAVLKEGFETSVFLLATFSAAESARTAATGAVLGIIVSSIIGWGIYAGGVKLNLSRFFRITGAFLILVAAGLVVSMLRTAHEAGWLNAGQQKTIDLSWLVRPGSVQSALITGVLGIPADPRLIEVIGWFAYLVPVALYVYWPAKRRPQGKQVARVHYGAAAGLAGAALLLAFAYPNPTASEMPPLALVAGTDSAQQVVGGAALSSQSGAQAMTVSLDGESPRTVPLAPGGAKQQIRDGVNASVWTVTNTTPQEGGPQTITLDELVTLAGGRIPIGIDPKAQPGPYTIERSSVATDTIWVAHDLLIDASESSKTIATISGGGLDAPRTITIRGSETDGWAAASDDARRAAGEANDLMVAVEEHDFWSRTLPIALGIGAVLFALAGYRLSRRRSGISTPGAGTTTSLSYGSNTPVFSRANGSQPRSDTHAAH